MKIVFIQLEVFRGNKLGNMCISIKQREDYKMKTINGLDNVCIMQKYHDSERVLECREKFEQSMKFIVKACNNHEKLLEACKYTAPHLKEYCDYYNKMGGCSIEMEIALELLQEAIKESEV